MTRGVCRSYLSFLLFSIVAAASFAASANADGPSPLDQAVDDLVQSASVLNLEQPPAPVPVQPPARPDAGEAEVRPPAAVERRPSVPGRDARLLAALFRRTPQSRPSDRLAGTPSMFGDFFNIGGDVFVDLGGVAAQADLPLAAGCRRMKACEDNQALTRDRVFLWYNRFDDALEATVTAPNAVADRFAVDRFTLGFEKTLLDGRWSMEVRMPLADDMQFATADFGISGGSVGNLAVLLKRMLYESEWAACSAGLGIDIPTGSDTQGYVTGITDFTLQNQAVHLMPFLALTGAPSDCFFYHAFLQIDVPANGNRVDRDGATVGVLQEQTLLYADIGVGAWLYRNPHDRYLTGLAALLELHYTGTLQDSDLVAPLVDRLEFGNFANRVDVVNCTAGLHLNVTEMTVCRMGVAAPLTQDDNRVFDFEVLVQLERRF
jgi:hypothetical protein